jgi:hypothetical protein
LEPWRYFVRIARFPNPTHLRLMPPRDVHGRH